MSKPYTLEHVAQLAGFSTRPAGLHPAFAPVTEREPVRSTDPRDQPLPFILTPAERSLAARASVELAWQVAERNALDGAA